MVKSIDRYWKASFHDNDIVFAERSENTYVGARSLVNGMGLSWGTQYSKIKNDFSGFLIKTSGHGSRLRQALAIHKNFIKSYLETIDASRVSSENSNIVRLYKSEFSDFVESQTRIGGKRDVDFYLENDVRFLIEDAFKLQNQGIIKRFSELLSEMQLRPDNHYVVPDTMLDIAEILAVNQHKL